ncbi:MAG: hypothetical protein KGI55_02085 [Gammaproteobacteria bacterium]|nr:hypothetical protein [Gammaproteobacteria bacterium]
MFVHVVRAGSFALLPGYRRDGENLNVVVPSLERIPPAVTAFVEFAVSQIRASLAPKA